MIAHIQKIRNGITTQTRRKRMYSDVRVINRHKQVIAIRGKYKLGETYTGTQLLGYRVDGVRFRVTHLRFEDVRRISFDDVRLEGYILPHELLTDWCAKYDKDALPLLLTAIWRPRQNAEELYNRPDKRYQSLVIGFEVVEGIK